MKFEYKKECNIRIGQRLYGIIALTPTTYYGVYGIEVDCIDWNEEHVIFKVNQPCEYVACNFDEVSAYVFGSRTEAEESMRKIGSVDGLHMY